MEYNEDMSLREELQKIVKGEVMDEEEILKKYSRDYSIFEVKPQVVVFPKEEQDVKQIVLFVNKHPEKKALHYSAVRRHGYVGRAISRFYYTRFFQAHEQVKDDWEELCRGTARNVLSRF